MVSDVRTIRHFIERLHRPEAEGLSAAWYVQWLVRLVRDWSMGRCELQARKIGERYNGKKCLNLGGGNGSRWPGMESIDAATHPGMDFNTSRLPYETGTFDFVVCEQVIEHLHNQTHFLSELRRITKPCGHILLSTENLRSIPNMLALLLGKTPFSLQACCGQYRDGWKRGPVNAPDKADRSAPTFSGMHGHVRVMTLGMLERLFEDAGLWISKRRLYGGRHYVLYLLWRQGTYEV